jgi:hypothetical protein
MMKKDFLQNQKKNQITPFLKILIKKQMRQLNSVFGEIKEVSKEELLELLKQLGVSFNKPNERTFFEKAFNSYQIDENKYGDLRMKSIISDSVQGKRNQKINKQIVTKMSIPKPKERDLHVQPEQNDMLDHQFVTPNGKKNINPIQFAQVGAKELSCKKCRLSFP